MLKIVDKNKNILYIIYSYKISEVKFMAKFKIDKEKLNSKSVNRTIRLKQETFNKLVEISENNGVSFNKIINECIEYALSHM